MATQTANGEPFEVEIISEPIEVTMLKRTDPTWRFTDANGHEHAYYVDGKIAPTEYSPTTCYSLPTLRWIVDREATDDYPEIGHYECRECGERVYPATASDMHRQFIPGPRRFVVNGEQVSGEEFVRRAKLAFPDMDLSQFSV